jgi:hypothetical protein
MVERGDVMRSDRLKQVMVELDPTFDEKAIGFTKYNKFLAEAASRGVATLRKLENGQFEVGVPSRKPSGDEAAVAYAGRPALTGAPEEGPPAAQKRGRGRGRGRGGRRGAAEPEAARAMPEREVEPAAEERRSEEPRPGGLDLRGAYVLLRDVVASISRGSDGGVRDSEVKREMLKRRSEFDEATLGFSKFSRFLKQAHDEEIVNVEQGEDGNFQISPIAVPETSGRAERRGRRDRKGRPSEAEERAEAGTAVAAGEPEAGAPRDGGAAADEPRAEKPERQRGKAEADRKRPVERREEEKAVTVEAEPEEAGPRARGLRLRRGGRGGTPPATAKPAAQGGTSAEGKAAEEKARAPTSREPEVATDRSRDSGDGPPSRSSSLSRFRHGGRGGRGGGAAAAGPATAAPEPDKEGASREAAGRGKSAAPPSGAPSEGPAEFMVRNYKGVGRKTAETLVNEFGDAVFEVIDSDPERIRSMLPGRRAEAVIAGRAAQRERV